MGRLLQSMTLGSFESMSETPVITIAVTQGFSLASYEGRVCERNRICLLVYCTCFICVRT